MESVPNVTNVQIVSTSPVSEANGGTVVPVAMGGGVYSSATNTTTVTTPVVVWRDRAYLRRRQEAARHVEQRVSASRPSSSNTSRTSTSRSSTSHAGVRR